MDHAKACSSSYLPLMLPSPKVSSAPSSIVRLVQGVDFFFNNRAHALKFISFVQSVVPAKYRSDKQLVSHNEHSATYNYKYTFSVEIVPVCRVSRDDCRICHHRQNF